jgi:hypothetical protein
MRWCWLRRTVWAVAVVPAKAVKTGLIPEAAVSGIIAPLS